MYHTGRAFVWAVIVIVVSSVRASLFSSKPLVIAHRGSPCSHPEETLESYQEALKQGADYLELDLVATQDNKLVLRHDATLDDSTNIKDLAASGSVTQSTGTRQLEPHGLSVTGYFVTDFTLQDLKKLTAVQPFAFRTSEYNKGASIASIKEIFAFWKQSWNDGANSGLYMELKHPQYHSDLGKDMPKLLMQEIQQAGVTPAEARNLVVQCFDLAALVKFSAYMKEAQYDIPLMLLVECETGLPNKDTMLKLKALSSEAGIGPDKSLLLATKGTSECGNAGQAVCKAGASRKHNGNCIGRLENGYSQLNPASGSPQHAWVEEAHSLGLVVHAWTLRNEDRYMALDFRGDPHLEIDALMSEDEGLGIDGVFVDCPVSAARWKKSYDKPGTANKSAVSRSRAGIRHAAEDEEEPDVKPAAAISTYALVGVLIIACAIYACVHNQRQSSAGVNGPYKVMTSPRVAEDDVRDSQRGSQSGTQRLSPVPPFNADSVNS